LPSNLKLADPAIMSRPAHRPLQELKPDAPKSVRDLTAGGAKAVFQRAGSAGKPLVVNIEKFATKEGDDPEAPPGPPETITLSAKVFGQPLRLDILQTVFTINTYAPFTFVPAHTRAFAALRVQTLCSAVWPFDSCCPAPSLSCDVKPLIILMIREDKPDRLPFTTEDCCRWHSPFLSC
jgi:hypothetical protein